MEIWGVVIHVYFRFRFAKKTMWIKLKSPHALFNSQETNRTYDSAGKYQGSWKTKINVLFSLVEGKLNYLFQTFDGNQY